MIPTFKPVYERIEHGKYKYRLCCGASYFSERYEKWVEIPEGRLSDGATGARDLPDSWSWWFHDELCSDAAWSDGTPCSNWQASMVLKDILDEEGYDLRKYTWKWATFLFGGWKIKRRVGWFK